MHQVLVIVHQETSDPGRIGQCLRHQGYHLDIRCPAVGDPLPPTLDAHNGVVVFGGPMSANDDPTLPFIRTELDWIETVALPSDRPYLGICLGAQLLARVLGARVAPHPQDVREIGYVPITVTPAGEEDFGCSALHVFQWHGEGFDIPTGAVQLAQGHVFPNQAFRYGDRAYGLQFHPEITRAMIDLWTTKAADQLHLPGAQPRHLQFQQHDLYSGAIATWLSEFLDQWLTGEACSAAA
jgi:GMP synthase (glutamine-hydrolysing)